MVNGDNHQPTTRKNESNISCLQSNIQTLQNKVEQLEKSKIDDIANMVTGIVLKQVKEIFIQMINSNKQVHQELYERINQECMRMTECQIGKVKNDMKQLENNFKSNNNINFLELQQNVKCLERDLKRNMNQYQMEMKKINNILNCDFKVEDLVNDSANGSTRVNSSTISNDSNCARMVKDNSTIMNDLINYCTHNYNGGIWNNFDKIEHFSNKHNFHGKFVLASDDNNLTSEISILKYCKKFGLYNDGINIQRLKNNNGINHLFVIQIRNVLLRKRFLAIVKSNMRLSITLFSHRYNKFYTSGGDQRRNGVARWFKKRWRSIQSC